MPVVGARPNFMKIAPLMRAIDRHNESPGGRRLETCLVHTGQHYDQAMSESFFHALGIPHPDMDLGIGSGTHAEQVGRTMIAFEKVVREWAPDWIVVVGDVNATCACSIVAKKEHRQLAHIEAGLRSFDLEMPEEINRMVTDRLSDLLLTPDALSDENLRQEGVAKERIVCVGNIMIDTLDANRTKAEQLDLNAIVAEKRISGADVPLEDDGFAILTLHRPSNVDRAETLAPIVEFLVQEVSETLPLLWTLHPRTRNNLQTFGLWETVTATPNIHLVNPLTYHEMVRLNLGARIALTDSGGLQEECCVLGTPCVTMRFNTERPVTLLEHGGFSKLVGHDIDAARAAFHEMRVMDKREHRPPLWDGHAAERVVSALVEEKGL